MAERLTLNRTGMKDPLDIASGPPASSQEPGAASTPSEPPTPRKPPRVRTPTAQDSLAADSEAANPPAPTPAPLDGRLGAYPIQTSVRIELELLERAADLADRAGVSVTALLFATLNDLPDPAAAAELIIAERVDHPDAVRVEQNLRMARELRRGLDALVAPYDRSLRGARSLLINAILRDRLPQSADAAKALIQAHLRQQTLAALNLDRGSASA
jgi:hypothetical protein